MVDTIKGVSYEKRYIFLMHIPIATTDLTRGLPSEETCRRLRTTCISAFNFLSSSESSSTPFDDVDPISRRFPSAKTAEALTWQDQIFIKYLVK
jgi:hypothetical protein